jgi:CheY-like chemotaxis protein
VVDDDEAVRGITAKMLELGGHRVAEAEDAAGALERLGAQRYDAVLTDIVMPRTNGLDLRSEVRKRCPEVLVVLTSAYPPEAVGEGVPVVPKPFDSATLLSALGDMMGEHRRKHHD